ncbi:MAG: hypothetical protein RQ833_07050 [Sphingomonadaceae bacterium]|nr:hypothetical protein [Sphingomonadaceae bacterium]
MRPLLVLALLAIAALPSLAIGQPAQGPDRRAGALAAMDKDVDRRISKAEWLAAGRRERRFAFVDKNSDGFVDKAEMVDAMQRLRAMRGNRGAADAAPQP